MLRLLVFDFDGVLVDSNALKQNAYREILSEEPGALPVLAAVQKERPEADRFGVLEETLRRLHSDVPNLSETVQHYTVRYNTLCENGTVSCVEIPGVSESLPVLQQKYILAICSDTPQEPLRRVIARRGWSSWFADVMGRPRSKEENFAQLFERHHVKASECLFLGDRERDRRAAISVGCYFVGMRNDGNNFIDTPRWQVQDLLEFVKLLPTLSLNVNVHV